MNGSSAHAFWLTAQKQCESRGGRPGLPVPKKPYGLCGRKATLNWTLFSELRSCVKVEVAVMGSLSLIRLVVSVDVRQHFKKKILDSLDTVSSSDEVVDSSQVLHQWATADVPAVELQAALETKLSNNHHRWSSYVRTKLVQQLSPLVVLQAAMKTELSNNYHRWSSYMLH